MSNENRNITDELLSLSITRKTGHPYSSNLGEIYPKPDRFRPKCKGGKGW